MCPLDITMGTHGDTHGNPHMELTVGSYGDFGHPWAPMGTHGGKDNNDTKYIVKLSVSFLH